MLLKHSPFLDPIPCSVLLVVCLTEPASILPQIRSSRLKVAIYQGLLKVPFAYIDKGKSSWCAGPDADMGKPSAKASSAANDTDSTSITTRFFHTLHLSWSIQQPTPNRTAHGHRCSWLWHDSWDRVTEPSSGFYFLNLLQPDLLQVQLTAAIRVNVLRREFPQGQDQGTELCLSCFLWVIHGTSKTLQQPLWTYLWPGDHARALWRSWDKSSTYCHNRSIYCYGPALTKEKLNRAFC